MRREFEVAELFQVEYMDEKRWCAVMKLHLDSIGYYHNGYVETKDNENIDYDETGHIFDEEITFGGVASFLQAYIKDVNMLGFDTLHIHDTPETQSFDDVRRRTVILAHQMIEEGV